MCDVKIGRLGKFDLNPRGDLWRKDENRFGHKFLSKFGWSQGKGLGKNEDGIAENLKVRMKLGNTGVGWDEKMPIGIDYREYDAVLEDLSRRYQKSGAVKGEEVSLEKRSQQFKNRIHYQKFVRGKDISRYSEKDMSCIFLSREPEKETEPTTKETTVTNIESRPADHSGKEPAPTFTSQMSMAEYFAMKMKNKISSSLNKPNESKICEESSQSDTDAKSKKRKHDSKIKKKAKRMKFETQFNSAGGSLLNEEESTSESSSSSQEAPEEMFIEKFQNVECKDTSIGGNMKKKKKMSKKEKKFLNALKSDQEVEDIQPEENNVVEKNSTENKSLEERSRKGSSYSEDYVTDEENTSEFSGSSQEAPEETLVSEEQFPNIEECNSESVKKKKKMSKKAKKLLNAFKSKKDLENNSVEEIKSLENLSHEGNFTSTEESSKITKQEVTSKKRKKEHKSCKKAKKRRLEEAEIFTSVEKNSSPSESDDEEKKSSEECKTTTEKQSHKESKKPKNKIFNLRSCLKNCLSNNKYNFKEKRKVSFCENISYKLIENVLKNFDSEVVLETNEQLLSCSDEDCTDSEAPNETENVGRDHINDSNSSGECNGDVQCGSEGASCDVDSDGAVENAVPECFKLPKCSSTNYNSWLETQRIAARMKVYKNMAKKMKRHPVLRKTNLLEIKGYGNWGL